MILPPRLTTVSYTHLDVYKRQIIHNSELIPNPVMTTYTIVVPATGIAGVPIAVQIERKAAMASVEGLISIPAAVAINVIAIICIAVVPFMLIVIPVGRTKPVSYTHLYTNKERCLQADCRL